jgi:uncharacterized protein (TIGR02246 family)
MKPLLVFLSAVALLLPVRLCALDAQSQIKAALNTQVAAWNKGDLQTFVSTYADNCVFVGKQIAQGKTQLLARYQKAYPTPAAMGRLSFTDPTVHMLDSDVAIVTARWHLDRSSAGGGPTGGVFSLVFHREGGAWKIALDHTS